VTLPSPDGAKALSGNDDDDDAFWNASSNRKLEVIVTPYRPGRHDATKPESFIPVIRQLEKLHAKGFVHGDIRGFNTVFDEEKNDGYLIDFDFGGKNREYPKGYRTGLPDGAREMESESNREILPWHDWFALGQLIFHVHLFSPPAEGAEDKNFRRVERAWKSIGADPTTEMKNELKELLTSLQDANWYVQPHPLYKKELDKVSCPGLRPNYGPIQVQRGAHQSRTSRTEVSSFNVRWDEM